MTIVGTAILFSAACFALIIGEGLLILMSDYRRGYVGTRLMVRDGAIGLLMMIGALSVFGAVVRLLMN